MKRALLFLALIIILDARRSAAQPVFSGLEVLGSPASGRFPPVGPAACWSGAGRRAPQASPSVPVRAAQPLRTRYPIVLAHGIMGFRCIQVAGVNFGNYFRGVEAHLRDLGVNLAADNVGMTNSVEQRAQRLKEQIDLHYPGQKVNIIAHSLGGLDSRQMITQLGMADRVASLTTVGTPHRGTYMADWACDYVGHGMGVEKLLNELGITVDAVHDLTSNWCRNFNTRTPDMPQVRYFSYGGQQPWYDITPAFVPCYWLMRVKETVLAGRSLDPVTEDYLLEQPWGKDVLAFARAEQQRVALVGVQDSDREIFARTKGANDGLVPLSKTSWGESFTVIPMDHLDQIGWLTSMDAPAYYELVVRDLVEKGL